MTKATKLSNLAVADAADKKQLDHIRDVIKTSDQLDVGSRRALYQALGAIFDLANSLLSDQRLEGFVRRQGQKWGKVAQSNPFQPLTVLAFTGSQNAAAASKYAKVLQYAAEEKPEADNFADWIEKSGGIEALAALARGASADPLEQYEETPDERYDRAVAALAEQSIGQLPKSAQVDMPGSYGRALVRQIDGRLEIVGIVPVEEEDVKADIFALVPTEPPHARRKLQDKPLYEIFRLCDLATRWFPKSALSDPIDETFVVDQQLSTDDYTHALQAGVSNKLRAKRADFVRYSQQTALRFSYVSGQWQAETVSTHPSFPVIQCRLSMALPELDTKAVYMLHAAQVNRVASTFVAIASWTVRVRKPTTKQGHDAGSEGEIVFDAFTSDYAWRELSQPKERCAEFLLSRAKLNAIGSWFEDFRAASKAENLGRLPKLMALSHEDGVSIVVPSLNAPDQGADPVSLKRRDRQKSGTLPFAPAQALEGVTDDLSDRFFKRQDLVSLVRIAADYGVDFDCRFLEYAEGIAALSALTDDWSVVIPLAVSLSGHYAGVVELIDNKSMQPAASDASGAINGVNEEADA